MTIVNLCLMTGLVVSLPFAASAQSEGRGTPGDIKYCNSLGRSYSSLFPVQEGMSASDVMTLAGCDSQTQATIAVLQKKLADKKIDLPHDDRIAQPPGSTSSGQ